MGLPFELPSITPPAITGGIVADCTIATTRNAAVLIDGVPATRKEPKLAATPDGQTVQTTYIIAGLPLFVGGVLDVAEGDMLTEDSRPAGMVQLVTPWPNVGQTHILAVRGG